MRRLTLSRDTTTSVSSPPPSGDLCRFLSEADEQGVLEVLREQFRHERITSDDVRLVVRTVASHGGAVRLPPDFPPMRWIHEEFKRAHGLTQVNGRFACLPGSGPDRLEARCDNSSSYTAPVTVSSDSGNERLQVNYLDPSTFARFGMQPSYDIVSPLQHSRRQQQQQKMQHQRRSLVVDAHRAGHSWQEHEYSRDNEELGSNASSGSFDNENGTTTGSSSSSSTDASTGLTSSANGSNKINSNNASQDTASTTNKKRDYELSHMVPPETWEKAVAAVEQQGMSLRAAAKMYGVHFAALHRRAKKRAQGGQSAKGNNDYLHPNDEAKIVRVVVAHAELGVLMTFDELMKLVEAVALRKLPDITVENAYKLMLRFQSRNEKSIRHIIVDWPPPIPKGGSNYHLDHPGYAYDFGVPSSSATTQQTFAARCAGVTGSSQFLPSGNKPVLPSIRICNSPHPIPGSAVSSSPMQLQRVLQNFHPVMFV